MKKVYNISGFECANCAAKVERHLAKHPKIANVRLDFAGNKLYMNYKGEEMTIEEILAVIAEVESDEIEITPNDTQVKKTKIFDKSFFTLLARVLVGVLVVVLNYTVFAFDCEGPHMYGEWQFWANFIAYFIAIVVLTYDILWKVIKKIIHLENPIDEYLLISISVIGAYIIAAIDSGDFMESVMVVTLFQVGRIFEGIATNKSKEAIMSAVDLRVSYANKVDGESVKRVAPEELKVGDIVVVNVGEMIPTDGVIVEGTANIDTSSLTGEFMPVEANVKSDVFAGCLVKTGMIKVEVKKEYKDSTVSKIMELVTTSGERKSKADKFITKFARLYTPIVFIVSIIFAVIGGLITNEWSLFVLTGLKMLVIACPCAVVISIPMAYFSAIGLASKNGIVIKGTTFFDELNRMKKLVSDKTGTITKGSFSITTIEMAEGVSKEELLENLYAAECLSTHPIARAVCHEVDTSKIANSLENYEEIVGQGVKTLYQGKEVVAGNSKMMKALNYEVPEVKGMGVTIYCVADSKYLGYVILSDSVKPEAVELVSALHKDKMEVVLLTGDKEENAKIISQEIGIDRYHSELLPEDKTKLLETEMSKGYATAYIGDGINDAASIRMADIGVAMGGIGSDVAVENADVIIMNDDPYKVYDAYKIAKIAHRTAKFNLITALAIKLSIEAVAITFSLLNYFGVSGWSLPMWAAVLADTGLTVALVINSLLILYRKIRK